MPSRHAFGLRYRHLLFGVWIVLALGAAYLFFFHREATQHELRDLMSISLYGAAAIYVALIILRGFILLPAAPLLLLGVAFFPPVPLFLLTLVGNLVPTAFIYRFHSVLHLEELFTQRHNARIARLKELLVRRQLPVIVVWSFLPFTPTTLIVYACGVFRIGLGKTLLGVTLGAGANAALYIFLGDFFLRSAGLKN